MSRLWQSARRGIYSCLIGIDSVILRSVLILTGIPELMHKLKIPKYLWCFLALSTGVFGQEGYSSAEPGVPANIYSRAFTLMIHQQVCEDSPDVARISLKLFRDVMVVGERIRTNRADDSVVSDLVIEAFDASGNFLPAVPVYSSVSSAGRTRDFDPGVVYRDGSMDYWELRKAGEIEVSAYWACAKTREALVGDTLLIKVLKAAVDA